MNSVSPWLNTNCNTNTDSCHCKCIFIDNILGKDKILSTFPWFKSLLEYALQKGFPAEKN